MTLEATKPLNDVDLRTVAGLAEAINAEPEKGATVWKADVTWKGAFRSEVQIRDFTPVQSDEPEALGGSDTAPNPVEQLLAALGNCLAVGYAANATAAGVEINNLRIELEGDLDLHTFLGLNPDGNAGYQAIRAKVTLDTDAPSETIEELHQRVIGTSPVGHTLARSVPLHVDLV